VPGVLAITSYPALDVFIGLAFLYFLLSIVCSSINEGIATALNLRAKDLETGVVHLLGDQSAANRFFENPRIKALSKPKRRLDFISFLGDKRPSYIPSRAFALTVIEEFAPAGADKSGSLLAQGRRIVNDLPDPIKRIVSDALTEAGNNAEEFRKSLERQFDEIMQRASGWYKRRVQLILFVIALILVGAINADSFAIGQRLWKDDALRTAVVQQATNTVGQGEAACTKAAGGGAVPTPAQKAAQCLDQVKQLGLPLGWSKASSPRTWESDLGKALGLLLTAFALLLGAPFWFDTLSKLAQLRGTGRASSNPSTTDGATTGATA
jgi:hypothetical protein